MTERMIENRIKKLRELKAQQEELEAAAEAIQGNLGYAYRRFYSGPLRTLH